MFKKIFLSIMFCCVALSASAVELDSLGRDPNYVKSILKRSEKIVDNLGITAPAVKQNVLYILANRYFKLNDIYEVRDQKVKYAKAVLTGASKQAAIEAAELEKDATLYRCHFEFPASLSLYINDKQIVLKKYWGLDNIKLIKQQIGTSNHKDKMDAKKR